MTREYIRHNACKTRERVGRDASETREHVRHEVKKHIGYETRRAYNLADSYSIKLNCDLSNKAKSRKRTTLVN